MARIEYEENSIHMANRKKSNTFDKLWKYIERP